MFTYPSNTSLLLFTAPSTQLLRKAELLLYEDKQYAPVSKDEESSLVVACQQNDWVARGGLPWQDDPYLEDYPYEFCQADSIDELSDFFAHGNWAIRQGIVYEDLAFIQQIDGGDEWWTLKKTDGGWSDFESISAAHMIKKDPQEFTRTIECMHAATPEQCRNHNYMRAISDETLSSRAEQARTASAVLKNPCPSHPLDLDRADIQ